jgi:DNA-binding XRE family transcriptional regulator
LFGLDRLALHLTYGQHRPSTTSKGRAQIDLRAIGRRIRELRGFDMTQAQFARRIGVTQSYLSALEHGEKEPGATVLLAISKEFGNSVDWLLTGKTEK